MMKNNILLPGLALMLLACGGGGGGGNANNGGFQQPIAPELNVSVNPKMILPNPSGYRYESLSNDAKALVTIYARQGNTPVENGDTELQVSLNEAVGSTGGYIYCFEAGNDMCTETVKDEDGKEYEVLQALGKVQLDLAAGRGMFAVTARDGKEGHIGINVTISGPNNATVSKDIRIPVGYNSSGVAHQITINATDILRPDQVGNVSISITDEAGNPVSDPKASNLIVTANNLSGTTLGLNGETGMSVTGQSDKGKAEVSVLPTQEGYLTIIAQSDKDNNIENGVQELITAAKTIRVTNDVIPVIPDVVISGGKLPNGIVGVDYGDFRVSTTGNTSDFSFVEGSLPPGLIFDQGVIKGTPTLAGEYTFTVKATGVNGSTDTKELTITVIEGGFKFDRDAFDSLDKIVRNMDPNEADVCENVGQILTIEPLENYTLKPPFTWKMDAGGIPTALGVNKAKRVVTANGVALANLDFTVTDDTTQVTLNGKVCPSAPSAVFNGHAIILSATDANGFEFETVLPLSINLTIKSYTPPKD